MNTNPMLPYDICVALKKAGFPQRGDYCYVAVESNGAWSYEHRYIGNVYPALLERINIAAYSPTLEELIEACNPPMYRLEFDEENTYSAYAGSSDKHFDGHGSTPSEAVANLYLAITK